MRHHIFKFQIISFKKYFYVSLGNNFFYCFCGGPGQLPSLPSLKSGPAYIIRSAIVKMRPVCLTKEHLKLSGTEC